MNVSKYYKTVELFFLETLKDVDKVEKYLLWSEVTKSCEFLFIMNPRSRIKASLTTRSKRTQLYDVYLDIILNSHIIKFELLSVSSC